MNSPSDDDMFSRYRSELVMDADARARTFRKLQERVLRGEQPAPEIDVLPPQTAALRGLWSLPAKWIVTIAGLGVGALIVANVALRDTPLTAADEERMLVQPAAAAVAELEQEQVADAEREPEPRAVPRAQVKSAARATSPRANAELAKRSGAAPGPQLTAAMRVQEPGSSAGTREAGQQPAAATRMQSSPSAIDDASQIVAPGDSKLSESATPEKQGYISPKVPQRSAKEIASETLTKEVQLLQAAQLALRAGDTQRSLALLAEHTWTYPQGHLAEARDVARILALCQAGNVAQSKLHAKRFLQQRPESPYALRVRAGCAAMTDASDPRREPTP